MQVSSCRSRSSVAGLTIARRAASTSSASDRLDVRLPGTMAALAVDALGQRAAESRALPSSVDRRTRVAVVARHAVPHR